MIPGRFGLLRINFLYNTIPGNSKIEIPEKEIRKNNSMFIHVFLHKKSPFVKRGSIFFIIHNSPQLLYPIKEEIKIVADV